MDLELTASQSDTAKLQILTLSAKLLVLSHLAPLTPHLRALALLFTYLTTLARYDLTYEVRDRSRFLKGLLSSAGVGVVREEARLGLSEEDFVKGVQLEEQVGGEVEERTMTGEQVRAVLFDGKEGGDSLGTGASVCPVDLTQADVSSRRTRDRRTRLLRPRPPFQATRFLLASPRFPDHRTPFHTPRRPHRRLPQIPLVLLLLPLSLPDAVTGIWL